MPRPSTPSSVRIRSVTKFCVAPLGVGPSASGSSSGTRAIRLSICVIFMAVFFEMYRREAES
jgi:hypothetical protein